MTGSPSLRGARELLREALRAEGPLLWLTGAGVSAESGVPTFRGPEGYWREGSVHYHPMQLATAAAFAREPERVWAWYLYRRGVCRRARPNEAHRALARLAERLERTVLVTQNVDGLHRRAGHPEASLFEIHGNLELGRCARACPARGPLPFPLPPAVPTSWPKDTPLGEAERAALRCPDCGGWLRPHVLWFDECYDEPRFRFESSLRAGERAAALVVVGTSGATTLPTLLVQRAAERGIPLLVVDPEPTDYARLAEALPGGLALRGTAGQWVPRLCAVLAELAEAQ